jgi:hypothetical protein
MITWLVWLLVISLVDVANIYFVGVEK